MDWMRSDWGMVVIAEAPYRDEAPDEAHPFILGETCAGAKPTLALDDVEGQAAEGGFLVARLHVEAGAVHGFDDLVERELVGVGVGEGEAGGVDGFDGAHAVALDAGDLDEAADGIAGHAEVVFHGDLGGVLDLGVGSAERGDEAAGSHGAGDADLALAADLGAGDAGVLLVEDADGGGGEKEAEQGGAMEGREAERGEWLGDGGWPLEPAAGELGDAEVVAGCRARWRG